MLSASSTLYTSYSYRHGIGILLLSHLITLCFGTLRRGQIEKETLIPIVYSCEEEPCDPRCRWFIAGTTFFCRSIVRERRCLRSLTYRALPRPTPRRTRTKTCRRIPRKVSRAPWFSVRTPISVMRRFGPDTLGKVNGSNGVVGPALRLMVDSGLPEGFAVPTCLWRFTVVLNRFIIVINIRQARCWHASWDSSEKSILHCSKFSGRRDLPFC